MLAKVNALKETKRAKRERIQEVRMLYKVDLEKVEQIYQSVLDGIDMRRGNMHSNMVNDAETYQREQEHKRAKYDREYRDEEKEARVDMVHNAKKLEEKMDEKNTKYEEDVAKLEEGIYEVLMTHRDQRQGGTKESERS